MQPSDRHQQDHDKPEEPRLARSLDGGETWTIETSRDLLPPNQGGRQPQDLSEPIDFQRPGFAMTIRFLDSNTGPSLLWFTYDKGRTWKGPFRFPQFGNGVAARTDYLIDGNREATVFLTEAKSNHKEGRPFCARTSDGGLTWKFASYIGGEPRGFAIMPSTVRLDRNRLVTLVRVHDGRENRIDGYRSSDNAVSWNWVNTVAETGEFGGNPPMLIRLIDGRLCVTYGVRAQPYGIRAKFSDDNGTTWSDAVTIRDGAPAWEIGYPRSVQRPDGKIVTAYYFNDGPHNERFIESTVWTPPAPSAINLSTATVVAPPDNIAAKVLVEELEKRTGIRLKESATPPGREPSIVISAGAPIPAEGYRLYVDQSSGTPVVRISGADARGELFGAGQLLRRVTWARGEIRVAADLDITTSPRYPIRGHQLGYRTQANSYDAWSAAQFEQYIRELTFFGVNSIEGIPLQDDRPTAVMKTPRREMNRAIGEICKRYGLDYWVWIPVEFDLNDGPQRSKMLDRCNEFFTDTPELTGIFFPGGDPGHNAPELVIPFLQDMAERLRAAHPKAKVWLSLQWFTPQQIDYVYDYLNRVSPDWFGGLVAGPSSPPIPETRRRLPAKYKYRDYPDLTHNKLSQFQVPSWDQAYALTLGREAVNPRPAEYAMLHNRLAAYTDGFISYSDGAHDDVNKTVWSALSWDPDMNVRDIVIDYARAYFNSEVGLRAADAIFALEKNWHGPLKDNGAVEGTLLQWQQLERSAPELEKNWRWQMCLLRAYYDAYVRHRLFNETRLEQEANAEMAQAA
ncbi:MAG: exo-alpha-sialidase, partial [Acidobacteriaceae bacterium]|nr:exo-alpha-sialidase [Acidobacteriaceae bacterium]